MVARSTINVSLCCCSVLSFDAHRVEFHDRTFCHSTKMSRMIPLLYRMLHEYRCYDCGAKFSAALYLTPTISPDDLSLRSCTSILPLNFNSTSVHHTSVSRLSFNMDLATPAASSPARPSNHQATSSSLNSLTGPIEYAQIEDAFIPANLTCQFTP